MSTAEIVFPELHWAQKLIYNSDARIRVASCGRRFGKSAMSVPMCLEVALSGGRVWWLAPTFNNAIEAEEAFETVTRQLRDAGVSVRQSKQQHKFMFPSGGSIQVLSTTQPANLRGAGLDFVVLDEAAFMPPEVWRSIVKPMLWVSKGRAFIISTAFGRNWFYEEFLHATEGKTEHRVYYEGAIGDECGRLWVEGGDPEYAAFQFPTSANPFIDREILRRDSERMAQVDFEREFLSEFTDDQSAVFVNVDDCAIAEEQIEAKIGHQYIIGADLGRVNDFTVFSVGDIALRSQVFVVALKDTDYRTQIEQLKRLSQRYGNSPVVMETNGIADPIAEFASEAGIDIIPFHSSRASKEIVIRKLAIAFSTKGIKILPDKRQIKELKAFQATLRTGGTIQYGAPKGLHDDHVIAMALMWYGMTQDDEGIATVAVAQGLYRDPEIYKEGYNRRWWRHNLM